MVLKLLKHNQYFINLIIHRCLVKSTIKMDTAYFRHVDGDTHFEATFRFNHKKLGIDKQLNFRRRLDEPCSSFLSRINTNIEKVLVKKKKFKSKKNQPAGEPQEVCEINSSFIAGQSVILPDSPCSVIFDCEKAILSINEFKWNIDINPPWILCLALPKSIMLSFPIYLSKFEGLFMDVNCSEWIWYRSKSLAGPWTECSRDKRYTPTSQDLGNFLKVICIPRSKDNRVGPAEEAVSSNEVQASPGILPYETRHEFTTIRLDNDGFRVLSYNILADLYVDSEYSRTVLFGYCPAYALELSYRIQLLFKELLGYNADLMCLQEVDSKVFRHDLTPLFSEIGFRGEFSQKGDTASEGTATFYNCEKFECKQTLRLVLGEILGKEPIFANVWAKIQRNEALVKRVTELSTTIQILLLQNVHDVNQLIVLGNTHLYFHPNADHIRLLQAVLIMQYLEKFVETTKEQNKGANVSLLICGDFNSVPECGIYQLITTGKVDDAHIDWKSCEEEAILGVSHSHPLKMASACGTPEYTNYTVGFKACLDYIFYESDHLEVTQVVPMPSEEELSTHGGIPSVTFPSDHVALISDLRWK